MVTKTIMMATTHRLISNSYSRRRRRLQPIKTGVESPFFPPKQKNLQFSRRQRRHFSLAVCKTKLEGLKMNSFNNVRELLLNSFVNNVVSDREFVLLYDAYQSKNPDFNYQQHDPFNLDNIQIQPGLKAKLLLTRIYNLNQTINLQLYFTNQLTLEHIHVTFEGKAK